MKEDMGRKLKKRLIAWLSGMIILLGFCGCKSVNIGGGAKVYGPPPPKEEIQNQ